MQNKKIISILIIVMMIAFVVPQVTLASWWNPFSWGFWNKILNWKVQNPAVEKTIGGDKGSNGCLIAAGYSWCEIKNKCLRTWEEKCEIELKPDLPSSRYLHIEHIFDVAFWQKPFQMQHTRHPC